MKKIFAIFLVVIMYLSLVACGNDKNNIDIIETDTVLNDSVETDMQEAEFSGKDVVEDSTKEEQLLIQTDAGIVINQALFPGIIERIALTTENWKDYLKVYSYERENIVTDQFGDFISSTKYTTYMLGVGNEKYHKFEDASIEIKNKETGEIKLLNLSPAGYYMAQAENDGPVIPTDWSEDFDPDNFNLDNYECTRIKGYLYFVDIPEEAISEDRTYFMVGGDSFETYYNVDYFTKAISSKLGKYFE